MTKVIKGGTIVTADRTYEADILIEGEKIAEIGQNLKGDETIDASEAYVIPGGIDPHTHLEMPFMGTTAAETFESGTFAAAAGGTTMLVDFVLPGTRSRGSRSAPTSPTTWRSPAGPSRSSTRWPRW